MHLAQARISELERLLAEEQKKVDSSVKERQTKEAELLKIKDELTTQVSRPIS